MSLNSAMSIAAGAMKAHALRLNYVASNLANAETASPTEQGAYAAKRPIFAAVAQEQSGAMAVSTKGEHVSQEPAKAVYDPSHPLAGADGYVYYPNVNLAAEMADMISASRAYQLNADMLALSKTLIEKALAIGS